MLVLFSVKGLVVVLVGEPRWLCVGDDLDDTLCEGAVDVLRDIYRRAVEDFEDIVSISTVAGDHGFEVIKRKAADAAEYAEELVVDIADAAGRWGVGL